MNYKEQLLDPRWIEKRKKILKDDNYTCQYCGTTSKQLHVHHIEYNGLAWEAEDSRLISLCEVCHKILHSSHEFTDLENRLISMIRIAVLFTEGKDLSAIAMSQKANEIILKKLNATI